MSPTRDEPGRGPAGGSSSDSATTSEGAGTGDGRRSRRRRRRRRRGHGRSEGGAESSPSPGAAAVDDYPPDDDGGGYDDSDDDGGGSNAADDAPGGGGSSDDGGPGDAGRRRRRRRRRRGRGSSPQPQPPPPQAPRPTLAQEPARGPAPPHRRAPQPERPRDDGGGRGGRRRRRHRGRDRDGDWFDDSARAAPPERRPRRRTEENAGGGLESFIARGEQPANLLPERDPFTELVSIDPDERIELEIDPDDISMRVVDIITPIGKGQRGLIVAPPKTGKTTLLMQLARAISENHPEVELLVMLVDERPEEVTAFRRAGYGTVVASSNDESVARHVRLTAEVMNRAKQLVLEGKDVCVLMDSITRMARAFNNYQRGSMRTLSGGLDSRALERPKRFFGSARKILNGGSLTILGTALIDTGSRLDEVVFQEFKGTGNMELQLDRRLAERRVWPAIDIMRSGTRKEEKLFPKDEFEGVVALRRALSGKLPAEAMTMLINRLKDYKTNRLFLLDCAKRAAEVL